jgi:hypothetical protein
MSGYAVPSPSPSSSQTPAPSAAGATAPGTREAGEAGERVSLRRLLRVAPLATALAAVANLGVWLLTEALFAPPAGFLPMEPGPVVTFTVAGLLAASLVFAALARFTRRPVTLFRRIALVALVLSVVPNVLLLFDSSGAMFTEMSVPGVYALMVMHVVAAAVAVWALTTLTREPA